MSTHVIYTQKKDLARFLECSLNWTFIVVAGVVIFYFTWVISNIDTIATKILVNSAHIDHTYWSGSVLGAAMVVYAAAFGYPIYASEKLCHDKKYSFFPSILKTDRVWISAVTAVVAVPIMYYASTVFVHENNMLGTPHGHVRLMEDGSVITAGNSVTHDPTYVGSVPVSLYHDMNTHYVVKNKTGYAKYMTVAVDIRLDGDNEAFKKMLAQQDRESLGWGREEYSRTSSQTVVFRKIMTPLLKPAVNQVFQEIADGKLQGGNDIVMLRLGDVFNKMLKNNTIHVPSWINTINVTEVEVTGWQQS